MTKKEIVKQISEQANLTQLRTKEIVQMTFDAIIDALVTEGRIELRNFGVFEVKTRKARIARNPKTSEEVEVPAKNVVTFQPGKVMEEKVRQAKSRKRKPRLLVDEDPEESLVPVGIGGSDFESQDDDVETSERPKKPR
ncbi:MAG: HU family DNA-binding protein [Fimbriiglobus sp.]